MNFVTEKTELQEEGRAGRCTQVEHTGGAHLHQKVKSERDQECSWATVDVSVCNNCIITSHGANED